MPWANTSIALGAVRWRERNGKFAWNPIDEHIEKRAQYQSKDGEQPLGNEYRDFRQNGKGNYGQPFL
jgi:hypothetical protein